VYVGTNDLTLGTRLGFIRLAMEHGQIPNYDGDLKGLFKGLLG